MKPISTKRMPEDMSATRTTLRFRANLGSTQELRTPQDCFWSLTATFISSCNMRMMTSEYWRVYLSQTAVMCNAQELYRRHGLLGKLAWPGLLNGRLVTATAWRWDAMSVHAAMVQASLGRVVMYVLCIVTSSHTRVATLLQQCTTQPKTTT